jgi:hypothetical protein
VQQPPDLEVTEILEGKKQLDQSMLRTKLPRQLQLLQLLPLRPPLALPGNLQLNAEMKPQSPYSRLQVENSNRRQVRRVHPDLQQGVDVQKVEVQVERGAQRKEAARADREARRGVQADLEVET